jgi:hypothetical protein
MTATLLAEWTKVRTQRGVLIALGALGALMVGMSAFLAAQTQTDAVVGGDDDIVQLGLQGLFFAQLAAVVVGASFITAEYGSGLIRTTFTATPRRLDVLRAKAVVVAAVTFPVALASSALGFVIAQSLLRERGFVAPAYPPVSLSDPEVARAVVGTALLLTAYALLALGIGTIVRHSGAAIAVGFALVFLPLLVVGGLPEDSQRTLIQLTPLAGTTIQSTTGRLMLLPPEAGLPLSPWAGLAVAFAWALAALAGGYVLLRRRDA